MHLSKETFFLENLSFCKISFEFQGVNINLYSFLVTFLNGANSSNIIKIVIAGKIKMIRLQITNVSPIHF